MSRRPTEATKQFFDQWQLYQRIIEQDYMAHQGIHQAIGQCLDHHWDTPLQVLDLGCGDAQAIATTIAHRRIAAYTGVDLSPNALTLAAKNLAGMGHVELVCDDFLSYLASQSGSDRPRFDLIHLGFSLHHLLLPEKQQLLQSCRGLLKESGCLMIYDVFRQPGQSREDYFQAYLAIVKRDWARVSDEQFQAIADHIQNCDFPESVAQLTEMAQQAGFASPQSLFADAHGFHRLLAFCVQK